MPLPPTPPSSRILVVEDESALAELIETNLSAEGFGVVVAPDGETALERHAAQPADLIVLDLGLPGMGGFEVLRALRRKQDKVPVLILTSRAGSEDRIQGLHYGADDYLSKPFAMLELVARIRAILRRAGPPEAAKRALVSGPFKINLVQFTVHRGRVDLNLSMKEFRLLEVMTAHPGRVHSRQDLVNLAWEHDARPTLRTVDKHIQTLRKKLGDSDEHPVIQTLEREGYRWLLPVH
jgi:DNA-binding response OmpR family regulator